MATNKIHFLAFKTFPYVRNALKKQEFFSSTSAALVTTNDSVRCWSGPREYTHFTLNPLTGDVSWIQFPEAPVSQWTKELIQIAPKHDAGKASTIPVIDEDTVVREFWPHNRKTTQNILFFLHLVQDAAYDCFIRDVIDTTGKYEDQYLFAGNFLTGAQLRGKDLSGEMSRWTTGLINLLDDQFYVRVAKRYFVRTGFKADRQWIDDVMKPSIINAYSKELAEATVKFVFLSDKANSLIEQEDFDAEVWPIPNAVVDLYVDRLFEDMKKALEQLGMLN